MVPHYDIAPTEPIAVVREPHKLDVTLPAPWNAPVVAQVFDESAADWAEAKEHSVSPQNGSIRVHATLAPRA